MHLLALAAVVFLSSCASSSYLGRSPDDFVAEGSIITLNRAVTVPRNSVAASIRGGYIGTQQNYEGYCRLELWTISSNERVIEPDDFKVERTNWEWEYYGGFHPSNSYAGILTSDGPSVFWYTTYVYLSSDRQPDIYRLRCRHLQQGDFDPRYLTVGQMQTVLGSVMTLDGQSMDASVSDQ